MARPSAILSLLIFPTLFLLTESSSDTNSVFSPCADTTVQKSDGFTFGIVFAAKNATFINDSKNNAVQLSPCDRRLSLNNAQLAVFRPKVDEISLLTVNTSSFFPVTISFPSNIVFLCFYLCIVALVMRILGLVILYWDNWRNVVRTAKVCISGFFIRAIVYG
nr:uncharacterized LOC102588286 precursor [Ipomoea batatas]